MLEGRPVVLATAELPEGEVLVVEWGDEPAVVVEGAWTGKAWLLEGPPDTAAQMTFRVRSRAAGALRRAAGPQGGHLLASGIWDARNL